MKLWGCVFAIIMALGLSACQAPKAVHDVQKPSEFFGPEVVKLLKPGGKGRTAWYYVNEKADWTSYHKMQLDPVTFWRLPGDKDPQLSQADRQTLANYFYAVIHQAMSKYLTMVTQPGPGTLKVQVAITKAEPSVVVLDVISSVVPQAVAMSTVKDAITGKPAFVGDTAIACKVNDAQTGEILAAWAAERVGGKQLDKAQFDSWGDVEQAMRFWAEKASYRLCVLRKDTGCKPPAE